MSSTPESPDQPLLSIIVLAHDRRRYLQEAVRSVVDQDFERSRYEIIVVKNFVENELEAYLAKVGATSVYCPAVPAPDKVAAGFDRSRGRVILLLDDDDYFERTRLRVVAEAFGSRPNLGFFGNQVAYIDPDGARLAPRAPARVGNRPRNPSGNLLIEVPRNARSLRAIAHRRPDFNVGSTAVRREIVEQCRPYLARLRMTVDTMFFFAALVSPYSILLDERPLTRYRIHPENSSLAGGGPKEVRAQRLLDFARVAEEDYLVIQEYVRASRSWIGMRLMESRLLVVRLTASCRDPRAQRGTYARLLLKVPRYLDTYPVRESTPTVVAATLCLLSPRAGRAAYRNQMGVGA